MVIYNFNNDEVTQRRNLTIHAQSTDMFNIFLKKYNINKSFNLKKKKEQDSERMDKIEFDLFDNSINELIKNDMFQTIEFQVCAEQEALFSRLKEDYGKISNNCLYLYEKNKFTCKFVTEGNLKHKYPIYVISKGRYDVCLTAKCLQEYGIDFTLVIEPSEEELYRQYFNNLLVCPEDFSKRGNGGIPVRNFVLDHSKANGDFRHWILDDNIHGFYRMYNCKKSVLEGEDIFRPIEEYTDRYDNIYISGHDYSMFSIACATETLPIMQNTRVYSSILIRNDITELSDKDGSIRWRGTYNEDTDLSLRILKLGLPTFTCKYISCGKEQTGVLKGGNTDTIYKDDNGKKKTQALIDAHPDVTKMTVKFGRYHHNVDYTPFKNNVFIKKANTKKYINQMKMIEIECKISKSKIPDMNTIIDFIQPSAIRKEIDYKTLYENLKKDYDELVLKCNVIKSLLP